MKRKVVVILCLILCFMLSCNDEALDRVLIQGGMDAASPKVIVAVDPERIDDVSEDNAVSEEILKEKKLSKEDISEIVDKAISDAQNYIESDVREYVDSSLSSGKEEILDYIQKTSEETLNASIAANESLIVNSLEEARAFVEKEAKDYVDSSLNSMQVETQNYIDRVAEETRDEITESLQNAIDLSLNEKVSQLESDVYQYLERETISQNTEKSSRDTFGTISGDIIRNGIKYSLVSDGYEVVGYVDDIHCLIIPESINGILVTSISPGAFKGSLTLTGDVVLPRSLKRIGSEAFMNAKGLDGRVYIPDTLESIGDRAFYGCDNLSGELIIPDSVERIGDEAFAFCRKLGKSIYGGRGLVEIGVDVFIHSGIEKSYLPFPISELIGF